MDRIAGMTPRTTEKMRPTTPVRATTGTAATIPTTSYHTVLIKSANRICVKDKTICVIISYHSYYLTYGYFVTVVCGIVVFALIAAEVVDIMLIT